MLRRAGGPPGSDIRRGDVVDRRCVEAALGESINKEEEDDFDTFGGYLFSTLGRVPVKGEVLKIHPHFKFEILNADPRRIKLVRITRVTDAALVAPIA